VAKLDGLRPLLARKTERGLEEGSLGDTAPGQDPGSVEVGEGHELAVPAQGAEASQREDSGESSSRVSRGEE
jgi:hypothetical protein